MRVIDKIFVHCSAGFGGVASMRSHWKSMGWKNDGYHIVINLDGSIEYLNDFSVITNGVKGFNSKSIHICYVGGVREVSKGVWKGFDTRTPEQKESLLKVLKELRPCYPDAEILGHRDASPDMNGNGIIESFEWIRECPSFDAKNEYKNI